MAGEFCYVAKGNQDLGTVLQADGGSVAVGDWLFFGEGNQSIQTGLTTFSGLTGGSGADGFERITIKRGFTGNIGGPGGSLVADVSYNGTSVFTNDAGGGNLYYSPSSGGCDRLKLLGFGQTFLTGGTTTLIESHRGTLYASSAAAITTMQGAGGVLNIDTHASTAITSAAFTKCEVNCQRSLTTLYVMEGAVVNVFRADSGAAAKPTATTVWLTGGTLNWRGGNITTLNAYAPVDFSNVPGAITITNLNITAAAMAKSNLNEARSSGQPGVTITNLVVWGGYEDKLGTVLP